MTPHQELLFVNKILLKEEGLTAKSDLNELVVCEDYVGTYSSPAADFFEV